jgi:hypothetical protein
MKHRLNLSSMKNVLPPPLYEAVVLLSSEDAAVLRRSVAETAELYPGERAAVQYVSTRDVDRYAEVLDPDGALLDEFRLNPVVLWGHDYMLPPIGSDAWIRSDGYGILTKSVYATTDRAEEVWTLKQGGHLKTSSVGFIPLEWVENGGPGWTETVKRYARKWADQAPDWASVSALYTKWLLLEHSDVAIPANPYALVQAVSKGLRVPPEVARSLGLEEGQKGNAPADQAAAEPVVVRELVREMTSPEMVVREVVRPAAVVRQVSPSPADVRGLVSDVIDTLRGRV